MNRAPHTVIVPLICDYFEISAVMLWSQTQSREITYPRGVAAYLLNGSGLSYTQIARRTGVPRDNIAHAVQRIKHKERASDPRLLTDLARLRANLP